MRAPVGMLLLLALTSAPLPAQVCVPQSLALVLAGGGAKGFAHIGVLQSLERHGVRPDLIVGTSIGAHCMPAGSPAPRSIPWSGASRLPS
jgi:hypothetical protein